MIRKDKILLYSFFLCLNINCYTQDSLFVYDTIQIKGDISFFEIDQIGNIYQIHNDEIIKLSPFGKELYRYSNNFLGNISQLDVSNSLRPLVFYKELAKIVVLDNTLSQQDNYTIKLDELGLYRVKTIANSNMDNGVWMYDQDLKQILKVNTKLEIIQESGNLAVLLDKKNFSPLSMIEKNGRLYIGMKDDGLLIFDIYCSFLNSLDIQNSEYIQIEEETIYSWNGKELFSYNSKTHSSIYFVISENYKLILRFKDLYLALTKDKSCFHVLKVFEK